MSWATIILIEALFSIYLMWNLITQLINRCAPLDVVLFRHFIRQLDVGVSVTEASHIGHLGIGQLQQCSSIFILHLHDVKDTLHALRKRAWWLFYPLKQELEEMREESTEIPFLCSAWCARRWRRAAVWGMNPWTTWPGWPSEQAP